jgi:carnitine O-acetyltransferase
MSKTEANLFVNSIQFNIVSKNLGCERMSFYINEAAGDVRDMLMPSLQPEKAKL